MDGRVYGYRLDVCELLRIQQSGLEVTRVQMCIWLWTPLGWKIKFVSGNCVRGTHEFIPWTMKTFDHRD
jgi:hypothetical protein